MIPGIVAGQAPMNNPPIAGQVGAATVWQTGTTNTNPLEYDAVHLDSVGAYGSGQPSRLVMTQPALVRHLASHFQSGTTAGLASQLNGASFEGMGYHHGTSGNAFAGANCYSAPILADAGDYFTTAKTAGGGGGGSLFWWQAVELLHPSLKGALVRRTANQSMNTSLQAVVWQSEVYNEGGYFDPAFPTRLTIPADGLYRFTANLYFPTADWCYALMRLNGVDITRGIGTHSSRGSFAQMTSSPLQLVAGDYLEILGANGASVPLTAHPLTWFAIEKVDPAIKRCLVRPTGQTIGPSNPAVNFTEVYDPHNMFDAGINAQRIIVPAGCTQARLSMTAVSAWIGGKIEPGFTLNNSDTGSLVATSSEHALSALGPWVTVSPGDYASATFFAVNNRAISTDNVSWYSLECR